jgi:hypothetical protein
VAHREDLGHAFRLFDALAVGKSLEATQRDLLLGDDAPDVPLRTSDLYLADLVPGDTADARDRAADRLLAGTPKGDPDRSLAGQVAGAFGLSAPSTLVALAEDEEELLDTLDRLDADDKTWTASLTQATRANLAAFFEAHPGWRGRASSRAVRGMSEGARQELGRALLTALAEFTGSDLRAKADLEELLGARDEVGELRYRLEVRHAALLRVRALLYRSAGRATLAAAPAGPQARAVGALERCEALALPVVAAAAVAVKVNAPGASAGSGESRRVLPPLAVDLARAGELRPGFVGLRFRGASAAQQRALELPRGAAVVEGVHGEPARAAGLRVGDILIGPPDAPFFRPNQLQWWVALAEREAPLPVVVWRAGRRVTLSVRPIPWPDGPGRRRR